MPIRLGREQLITFAQAGRELPKPQSPATYWRWRTRGVNGVRLECVRIGKKWYTTREALFRFLAAQSGARGDVVAVEAEVDDLRRKGLIAG